MAMEDNESCGSRAVESYSSSSSPKQSRQQRQRLEVFNEVLSRLQDLEIQETKLPGFEEELWLHFNRFPPRYALDVNVERAEDVLTHKKLLHQAKDTSNQPALAVHLVQVHPISNGNASDCILLDSPKEYVQNASSHSNQLGTHPPPTFGSSPNLEALVHQADRTPTNNGNNIMNLATRNSRPMHEITFATIDRPKMLSKVTSILSGIGLNIQEAHAFSTIDGFSLDVFVVDGWPYEETELLRNALENEIYKTKEAQSSSKNDSLYTINGHNQTGSQPFTDYVKIPTDGTDVWEIDSSLLKFENKVASGSFGDLYKGTYCSQEVAIKVLKPEQVNVDMLAEFSQEVFILRKIRHKNVVQFLGACTRPPNLCIVTEFMSKGSVYNFLHKLRGVFTLPTLLKVAIDISKGMNYLHQNNIIHRDLKTANLLMDENEVVKVADFGVARVQAQTGVMTAETGTYRWMAPEVIEHKPYDNKADVFSFSIVLWELITGEIPYSYLTPLQAAVGVVQQGLRPTIPKHTHPKLAELLERCWQQDPSPRPDFSEILDVLWKIAVEISDEKGDRHKDRSIGGFFTALKKGQH